MTCLACLAIPLVLGGAGATGSTYGKQQLWKKIVMWISIILMTLASIIFIYYYINRNKCSTCISY